MATSGLLNILQLQIVQIVLVAYIGALFGEMGKEVDNNDNGSVSFGKFITSWLGSGFGGVMVGLLLEGTVAKGNNYVVLGGSGIAGFTGQQKSVKLATKILTIFISNSSKELSEEDDNDKDGTA